MKRKTAIQSRNDRMFDMFEKANRITKVQEAGLDIYALSVSARSEIICYLFNRPKQDKN